MSQWLNLSKAARMAGVKRKDLQQQIQQRALHTFEGMINSDELIRVYPHINLSDATEIERIEKIKEDSFQKCFQAKPETRVKELEQQLILLKSELNKSQTEKIIYQQIMTELTHKLSSMEADCDKKQKIMLQTVLGWLSKQTMIISQEH